MFPERQERFLPDVYRKHCFCQKHHTGQFRHQVASTLISPLVSVACPSIFMYLGRRVQQSEALMSPVGIVLVIVISLEFSSLTFPSKGHTVDAFSICDAERNVKRFLGYNRSKQHLHLVFMQKTVALCINANSNVTLYVVFCVCVKSAEGLYFIGYCPPHLSTKRNSKKGTLPRKYSQSSACNLPHPQ